MQVKAPPLLEKIFDDFFADSALHQQEEYLIKQQQQQQRELLSHNTYLLNQSISGSAELNDSAITLQRMNALHSHKSAEQARKQAKWDAVRMLGVLYALDKTHVGGLPHLLLHRHRIVLESEHRKLAHIEAHDRSKDLMEIFTTRVQTLIHASFDMICRGEVCVNEPQLFNMSPLTPIRVVPMLLAMAKMNLGLEKKVAKSGQQILNRDDKIAFLTRYTDRMHTKLQALGIKDWGQKDIQTKKTYQLMIQHNNKTGEKDLVEFYLGRYGSAPPGDEPTEMVTSVLPTEV
ncbi:hypothetical protein BGZ81_000639 [Podila clonocystis]|nr:hypothetical protein BGZ81_000639 [Podila clonocystis]